MKYFIIFFTLLAFALTPNLVFAITQTPQQKVDDLSQKVTETKNHESTLSDMIKYFDTSITLNEKDAQSTQEKIDQLNAQQTELQTQLHEPLHDLSWNLFLAYPFDTIKYLTNAFWQKYIAKNPNWNASNGQQAAAKRKQLQQLSDKLQLQRNQLNNIKSQKAYLLSLTQNDEKKYQDLLQQAQEELAAQQAIYTGKAKETKIGEVKAGDLIGQIILGASPCSTGTHLHFEIHQNNAPVDPAQFLNSSPIRWIFPIQHQENFTGTWSWPITLPAVGTQEFGMSWFAKPGGYSLQGAYNGAPHTGIDMISETENRQVFAPSSGTLYIGKEACGNGTLSYLKIEHTPQLASYYLHTTHQ